MVITTDDTDLKNLAEEVDQLKEELSRRKDEMESFLYAVSHDLRAPLRGINGFLGIFEKKYGDMVDEEGQRLIDKVHENAMKMDVLLNDLLTLSRMATLEMTIQVFDMSSVVAHAIADVSVDNDKVQFVVKGLKTVSGDAQMLTFLWNNLVDNAVKFTKGRAAPLIEIGMKETPKGEAFYISDNGVGFDMEYYHKVFELFQSLHDPREFPGNGVGLAVAKQIVDRHGGALWAEAAEDKGATFYFTMAGDIKQ